MDVREYVIDDLRRRANMLEQQVITVEQALDVPALEDVHRLLWQMLIEQADITLPQP